MDNSNPPRTGGQPRADRGAQSRYRPDGRGPLSGTARRAFEKQILGRPGLKGSRLAVLRTLLDDFCWGKPSCWPGNTRIARAAGLSVRTVQRALHDLEALGIIRILRRDRRLIVLVDHPHADRALDEPVSDCHAPGCRADASPRDSLSPKSLIRSSSEDETPPGPRAGEGDIFLSGSNESTNPAPRVISDTEPAPLPAGLDWRALAAELARQAKPELPASPAPVPVPRGRIGLDGAAAPADDPVIAGELARRAEARRSAEAMPTAAEILDAVLGTAGTRQEAHGGAGEVGEASTIEPSPANVGGRPERSGNVGRLAESAVIAALSAVGPGSTAREVTIATMRLTSLFGDGKSARYYRGVVNDVARGELPARIPIAAVENALRPGVVKPAAVFTRHVQRCREVASRGG